MLCRTKPHTFPVLESITCTEMRGECTHTSVCIKRVRSVSEILTPLKSVVKSWHSIYCHNFHFQKKIVMTNEFCSTFYN